MLRFWDIESYSNYFCICFIDENDLLEIFYLVNSRKDEKEVEKAAKDSGYTYKLYDLTKDSSRLRTYMEKIIPRGKDTTLLASFLGIEEEEVPEKEDFFVGFNTLHYDVPMTDKALSSSLSDKMKISTESLREFSDLIINDGVFVNTSSYARYGGQVDASYIDDSFHNQGKLTVGLKTLVGMFGGAIIESESNHTGFSKSIYEDTLYCINDVAELRDVVWPNKLAQTYETRQGLLKTYPKLKEKGVTVNSTSAKFVENIIAPDKPIEDSPVCSFMFPDARVAAERGIEPFDMLEYLKNWYMKNVYQVIQKTNPEVAKRHLAKFMSIYKFYDQVRGKNWNDSARHLQKHGIPAEPRDKRRNLMGEFGTYLSFIDKYGNISPTYVNFSLGGIHGAEVFQKQLDQDREAIRQLKEKYKYISKIPKGKVPQALLNLIKLQSRTSYQGYPQHLSHEIPHFYRNTQETDEIVDPEEFTPFIYDANPKENKEVLISRYKYTSTGLSIHQDFTGYYPMSATRLLLKR